MRFPFCLISERDAALEALISAIETVRFLMSERELLQQNIDAANELATNSMRIAREMVRLIEEGLDEDNLIMARDWARELSDVIAVREEHGL